MRAGQFYFETTASQKFNFVGGESEQSRFGFMAEMRKVRTPQNSALRNAKAASFDISIDRQADGKCNRKQTADPFRI